MIKPLTQHQIEIITDLFREVKGKAGVFVAADTQHHSPLYWMAHEKRGVIVIHKERYAGKVYRSVALTAVGVQWCLDNGINARKVAYMPSANKRARKTIAFQLPASDATVGQVELCKSKHDFVPVIRLAMTLYTTIGYHGMKALSQDVGNLSDAIGIAYEEIERLNAELGSERQRLTLERAALEAQTLEQSQFHNYLKSIDEQLKRLQDMPIPANTGRSSDLPQDNGLTQAKPLNAIAGAKPIEAPTFDDDEEDDLGLEIKKDESAAARTTQNFLKSILSLTDETNKPKTDYSKLPPRQRARMEKDNHDRQ